MSKKRIRVGDIFEIPLLDGRRAYGQYVYRDSESGPIVQIFDLILKETESFKIEMISKSRPLFPPVITGLFAAIRTGEWKVVGHLDVEDFVYPLFLSPLRGRDPFSVKKWYLWDGKRYTELGEALPEKYNTLEMTGVWAPFDLAKRIETGNNPNEKYFQGSGDSN